MEKLRIRGKRGFAPTEAQVGDISTSSVSKPWPVPSAPRAHESSSQIIHPRFPEKGRLRWEQGPLPLQLWELEQTLNS